MRCGYCRVAVCGLLLSVVKPSHARFMDIVRLREFCLSLGGASERMPFAGSRMVFARGMLCFYVGGKWFCIADTARPDHCTVKCDARAAETLVAEYEGVGFSKVGGLRRWIDIRFDADVPDRVLLDLVRRSYFATVDSLPSALRRELSESAD